jgi:hypothetical protein
MKIRAENWGKFMSWLQAKLKGNDNHGIFQILKVLKNIVFEEDLNLVEEDKT